MKNKVIERKYFREPKATNILTWRAKEQIRYLYSQNNNEDGIGTILDVFPISEQVGTIPLIDIHVYVIMIVISDIKQYYP